MSSRGSSSSDISPKGLRGVEKIFCRPPYRLDAGRTTTVKNILLPIVRNQNVIHQLRVNCHCTRVSLNCLEASQGIFGILTVLEPRLAASLKNKSKPIFV